MCFPYHSFHVYVQFLMKRLFLHTLTLFLFQHHFTQTHTMHTRIHAHFHMLCAEKKSPIIPFIIWLSFQPPAIPMCIVASKKSIGMKKTYDRSQSRMFF